jgi:thiosulfate dehydrogenase
VKIFVLGLIVGAVLVPLALAVYFYTGMAPVATSADAMPFEKRMADAALHAHLDKEMPKNLPIPADETNFAAGAKVYVNYCAACHGLPGQAETAIAKGEFPRPPQLFNGKGVTDDPPGETYWKVANGIRLTGMPAFRQTLSDTQAWQVSLLLANADRISPQLKNSLASSQPGVPR